MDGPGPVRLKRISLDVPGLAAGAEHRGLHKGVPVRTDPGSGRHSRELQRPLRLREDVRPGKEEMQPMQLLRGRDLPHPLKDEAPMRGLAAASLPPSLEEFVQQDLDAFWRWCPTPPDGLHRCGLLVKLFDYCGLTRKDHKVPAKVLRLDGALRALGVLATDRMEAHQRVAYEAFARSRKLQEAVARCGGVRLLWDQRRRAGKLCADTRAPLAVWVLAVIAEEAALEARAPGEAPAA